MVKKKQDILILYLANSSLESEVIGWAKHYGDKKKISMQSFSIISKIKKIISPLKNALHICLMLLLKKIGQGYPEFILKIIEFL